MSKRAADTTTSPGALKNLSREANADQDAQKLAEMGEFEDQYGDDFSDDDEEIIEAGVDGGDPGEDEDMGNSMDLDKQVYIPSRHKLAKDEILEPDSSAYHMLHRMNVKWPCLSFDLLTDDLGDERRSYPHTVYMVAGTQAQRPKDNEILVMKLSGLHKGWLASQEGDLGLALI